MFGKKLIFISKQELLLLLIAMNLFITFTSVEYFIMDLSILTWWLYRWWSLIRCSLNVLFWETMNVTFCFIDLFPVYVLAFMLQTLQDFNKTYIVKFGFEFLFIPFCTCKISNFFLIFVSVLFKFLSVWHWR